MIYVDYFVVIELGIELVEVVCVVVFEVEVCCGIVFVIVVDDFRE